MAWYDDKKRTSYVAEYKDAKAIDADAKKAGPKGWMIVSTTGEDGKVRVVGTLAKGALTGGVGLLMFGRSRKSSKVIVSWQRVPQTLSAPTPPPAATRPQPIPPGVTIGPDGRDRIPGPGGTPLYLDTKAVVGESQYQDALLRITGGKTEQGHRLRVSAELRRDPRNEFDRNAVMVLVKGQAVGYLNRELAQSWNPALAKFKNRFEVPADIVGGWDRGDGDTGHFGVQIWLPDLE